jgi:hypothetical protein
MFDEHFVASTVSSTKTVESLPEVRQESRPAARVEAPASSTYDDDDDPIVAELLAGIGED